jgi:hypothetical protein
MDQPLPDPSPQREAASSEAPPREVLMRRDPLKKVSDQDWPVIRHLVESGVRYKEVAERWGIKESTISTRASKERWLTPQRLALAKNGNAKVDDPANAVVDVWRQRGAESRDMIFDGAKRSLQRFFAMSPVPQSFAEAATAKKMLDDSINPNGTPSDSTKNVSISILAGKNFAPQPVVDV